MAELALLTGNSKPKLCSPVGYEMVDVGIATEVILAGQLVVQDASGWSKCPINQPDAHGVALKDYAANQGGCDFLIKGEMDGFTIAGGADLTPGVALYPSTTTAGAISNTAQSIATTPVVPYTPRMRACGKNRIRFNFV